MSEDLISQYVNQILLNKVSSLHLQRRIIEYYSSVNSQSDDSSFYMWVDSTIVVTDWLVNDEIQADDVSGGMDVVLLKHPLDKMIAIHLNDADSVNNSGFFLNSLCLVFPFLSEEGSQDEVPPLLDNGRVTIPDNS
jgi:hypothetical protein